MAEGIGIGSTVWIFVDDQRRYGEGEWQRFEIIGETRVSWVIQYTSWLQLKFPKKPDERGVHLTQETHKGYGGRMRVLFSEKAVEDAIWLAAHGRHIARVVGVCKDAAVLRQIAALVGYEPDEKRVAS